MLTYLDDDRAIAIRGSISLTDGTTFAITAANVIDYSISERCASGQELTVGDTRAATYRLTVADEAHQLAAGLLLGAEVTVELQLEGSEAWDPFGVWSIDDCDISRQSAAVRFSGSDALARDFDTPWTDPTYPATLGDLFARVCALTGATAAQATFRNSTVSVASAPAFADGTTCREVLGWIAQCAGGVARIDRAGALEILEYTPDREALAIGPGDFFRLRMGAGAAFAFNAVLVMEMSATEYTRYAIDSTLEDNAANSIRIARNPLLTPAIAQSLVTALEGLAATAARVEWVGDPAVSCGSVLAVTDTDGSTYNVLVTEQDLALSGGLSATAACELPSLLERSYSSGAVFTPDGKLSMGAVADGSIGLVKIAAGAQQALVLSAGSYYEVGRPNMLRSTRQGVQGWRKIYAASGDVTTYDFTNGTTQEPVRRLTASGAVTNLIVQNYRTYTKLVAGQTYTLSARIATYSKAGYFRFYTSTDGETWSDDGAVRGSIPAAEGVQNLSYTFTPSASVYIRVGVLFPSMASGAYIDLYDVWKLELGDTATPWMPAPGDTASGIVDGSVIIMDRDQMTFRGPVINLDVSGDAGDTRWDESGMTIPSINSPSTARRYDGPALLTVNPSADPDGVSIFRTLTDALAVLSHKSIDRAIQITIAANTTENNATLEGVTGSTPGTNPEIRIYGGDSAAAAKTLNGRLTVTDCVPKVRFWGLNVASASGDAVTVTRAFLQIGSYDSVTAPNGCALRAAEGGKIRAVGTALNGKTCARAEFGGWVLVSSAKGAGTTYAVDATDGGIVCLAGTIPTGSKHRANGGILQDDSTGTSGGGGTTPTSTTTVSASLTSARTYQSGGSGWLNTTETIQQGLNAGYQHFAVIQFDTTGWSGKTIASGELTLHRLSGGKGGPITVKLMTTASAAGSGTPTGTYTNHGTIGTIDRGETATFSIPAAALQEIASGTRTSLMLYDNGSAWGGRTFSENYAMFSGSSDSTAANRPKLSVTYNN